MKITTYEKGQYVRSRGGYPARALGIDRFCLRKTPRGALLLDTIRQADVTVQEHQVPTLNELSAYLDSHGMAHLSHTAHAGKTRESLMGLRRG